MLQPRNYLYHFRILSFIHSCYFSFPRLFLDSSLPYYSVIPKDIHFQYILCNSRAPQIISHSLGAIPNSLSIPLFLYHSSNSGISLSFLHNTIAVSVAFYQCYFYVPHCHSCDTPHHSCDTPRHSCDTPRHSRELKRRESRNKIPQIQKA